MFLNQFNDTNFNHLPTINYAQASTSVSTSSTSKSSKKASTTKSNACSTISTPPTKKRPTAKKDQKAVKEKKSKACKRTAADKHSSSKAGKQLFYYSQHPKTGRVRLLNGLFRPVVEWYFQICVF
jgi:hypothetical protein